MNESNSDPLWSAGLVNDLVEVTKISSKDPILQRTEDQIVPKMVGAVSRR